LLAWLASRGDDAAVRALDAMLATEVAAVARRIHRAPAFADELRQAVRVRLLVGDGGRVRIADYGARGPLGAWLGVAALRVALNLKRAGKAPAPDLLADLVPDEPDPELRHLKSLYRGELRDALSEALAALPERQRAVLRLCYVDGLRMYELARLYGVHETTASRWVSQATTAAADDARRRLMARLSLSRSSADSITRLVASQLDVSIARILRG
jgi:RNA polymerase sigma-70 factor, ECF subfamily